MRYRALGVSRASAGLLLLWLALTACRTGSQISSDEYRVEEALAARDTVAFVDWGRRTVHVASGARGAVGARWKIDDPSANEWLLADPAGARIAVRVNEVPEGQVMPPGRIEVGSRRVRRHRRCGENRPPGTDNVQCTPSLTGAFQIVQRSGYARCVEGEEMCDEQLVQVGEIIDYREQTVCVTERARMPYRRWVCL
ncbi:MAG: hypothetical protein JXB05_00420 [Myxococcaceae bacterium]|nr:hypothetical protein [Myxococcaceae bacterium]